MVNSVLHRRETLLFTTIDVINEYGIQNVSTKEIARRQKVSEATVFKHFKTKHDLLNAVLDYYVQYDADLIESTKDRMDNPLDALRFYISAYSIYYENYPAITAINQSYDIMTCDEELGKRIKAIYNQRLNMIEQIFIAAKAAKQIDENVNTEMLADITWGTCQTINLKWRLNDYGFSLNKYTIESLEMIIQAFVAKN
ncbi:hypothetical protein BHU72_06635 [Desulfuribacillus stibiiarsenatis]|uniref:HTH tetR-type domain-containing protein n=1 Tax=Desulfuribacillus stibiiarsenatis TaxID=1390249 RepID=A0A1E5L447_9FIRM|nr:TetR/AcrR family transcriptional regulator [Desulfuribacillus stibiiarsenatis]OEH84866.1 hypothetical protein BHU72_06635 [Desulfuribacillus stibiiarsenatis]